LAYQLENSGSKVLFTCATLLPAALQAAEKAGIPKSKIYLLDLPEPMMAGVNFSGEFKTVAQLIQEGRSLPRVEKLKWSSGQGARQAAFLCYSSGTSGLPVCREQRTF
jgi:acyl-CoA synthetase (AMP-forming)/AMP-acid ligase II